MNISFIAYLGTFGECWLLNISLKLNNKKHWSLKLFNPLLPIAHKSARIDKISILKLEGIIKKISYERRDYESVDEKKPI